MEYLILACIVLVLLAVVHSVGKQKDDAGWSKVRSGWGKPKNEKFYFSLIGKYADLSKPAFHRLTDQTIADIDLHRLFGFIDRTTSVVGQQFLYKKLIQPAARVDVQSEKQIRLFSGDVALREKIQKVLLLLTEHDAYHIPSLLYHEVLKKPWWYWLLWADVALVLCLVGLTFVFPMSLVFVILPLSVNMFLHLFNRERMFYLVRSVPQLAILVEIAGQLSKIPALEVNQNAEVIQAVARMKSFVRSSALIRFSSGGVAGFVGQPLRDSLKVLFLIEVIALYRVTRLLRERQADILTLFEFVGRIDASISVASLRAGNLTTCQPMFVNSGKELSAINVYHPLVKDCIRNDLSINKKSILITGSNMSGKSTFLRTVAINSILAQTINTCFADEFHTPVLRQWSSIRIDDNLFEGKSYFFEEVGVMGSLIEEVDSGQQNLFILDEVLKGTNTVERISAAKAILSWLNRKDNIVIVSTHDIELATMLEAEYDLYHFTETVTHGKIYFDHTLYPGPLTRRNAIRLLEIAGYPPEIVEEARLISERMRTGVVD